MGIVPKALAAFVFVMAIPTFMLAGLNLVDPESAVMTHDCFWTPTAFDRFFSLPLHEHPLLFALVSGAVLVVAFVIAARNDRHLLGRHLAGFLGT